jgi:drug/metabolite transporter (DMT)-like permease
LKKWFAFGTLCLIFGSGFMFIDIAVRQVTALELTVFRLSVGTTAMLLVVYFSGLRIPRSWPAVRGLIIVGLAHNTFPFLMVAWAQSQGLGSGLAGVLIATNPLFTLIVAHFVFADERMTLPKIVGVVAGFIGVIILASRNWQDGELITEGLIGQVAVVIAAFLFASSGTLSRHLMQTSVRHPLAVSAGTLVTATVASWVLLLLTALSGQPITPLESLRLETIGALMFLSVFNTFIGFLLVFYVIRELGVTRSSTMAYVVPIISLAMGAIFLGEVLDVPIILGTVVILSAIAIVNVGAHLSRPRQQREPSPIETPIPRA